ncbi:hypothetical protein JY651_30355 [Pyxidicoccus parkwayensis]|uniref:Fibronectin type-III domain-containing protein n=1 Tax=Pyxidicoccus parkwayensis TaxID=2813578 RepID=A0ABX7NL69_9BACT|nr:fibronectin type III domain-containing protein [Pyxidicoccus parkwaysis]QSQ19604.1 hypothetical protein JY651_30355 [Pyxidicoccus parkwaysis]
MSLGCSEDSEPTPDSGTAVDGGAVGDAGSDAGQATDDAGTGTVDAGADAGSDSDAGTEPADSGSDAGTDGGIGSIDGGTDAGPADDVVHVRRFMRYRTAAGITQVPEDFTKNPVELFVEDGDALVPVPGQAAGPGELAFPDVPHVTYYLKVGTEYVKTDVRSVDLSINKLGRPDIQALQYPSTAYLDLRGLDPWQEYRFDSSQGPLAETAWSQLQLLSEELGLNADMTPDYVQDGWEYAVGPVHLSIGSNPMPRFEEARGDRARVVQLSPQPLYSAPLPDGGIQEYVSAVRALHLPPFSHDGTQELPVAGTLEPLSMQEFPLDWKVSAFAAHVAEVNPAAVLRGPYFDLYPAAYGLADGWFGYSGFLLDLSRPFGLGTDVSGTLVYGNPYPADWGLVARASVPFAVRVRADNNGEIFRMATSMTVSRRVTPGDTRPFVPGILPPRELTLDGTEAYSSRHLSAGTHVLEWKPPPGAQADAYLVTLYRRDYGGPNGPTFVTAARLYTDGSATSIRLPEGLLQPTTLYFLTVQAYDVEGFSPERPLALRDAVDFSDAAALSGLLSTHPQPQ